jgi:hypothetical protein
MTEAEDVVRGGSAPSMQAQRKAHLQHMLFMHFDTPTKDRHMKRNKTAMNQLSFVIHRISKPKNGLSVYLCKRLDSLIDACNTRRRRIQPSRFLPEPLMCDV